MADEKMIDCYSLVSAEGPDLSVSPGERKTLPAKLAQSMIDRGDLVKWSKGLTREKAEAQAAKIRNKAIAGDADAREVAAASGAAARETAGG